MKRNGETSKRNTIARDLRTPKYNHKIIPAQGQAIIQPERLHKTMKNLELYITKTGAYSAGFLAVSMGLATSFRSQYHVQGGDQGYAVRLLGPQGDTIGWLHEDWKVKASAWFNQQHPSAKPLVFA